MSGEIPRREIVQSAAVFCCPFCDYKGMGGLFHVRDTHPDKVEEWQEQARSDEKKEISQTEMDDAMALAVKRRPNRPVKKMYSITRRLEFDAGHRVYGHEGKCSSCHGHRYSVELTCRPGTGHGLDDIGRVVDFSVIKDVVGSWIDETFDHGMILFKDDPLTKIWELFGQNLATHVEVYPITNAVGDVGTQKYYIMDENPTAENIAELIYHKANELLAGHYIWVEKVVVHETPNCRAEYSE